MRVRLEEEAKDTEKDTEGEIEKQEREKMRWAEAQGGRKEDIQLS